MRSFKTIFLERGRLHLGLVSVFVAITLLVIVNSLLHHPEIGYDANDHLLYMQVLPQRLPTDADTREFFSPPLPYILPALIDEACISARNEASECRYLGGKIGQLLNAMLAFGTLFLVLQIAELWHPGNARFKFLSLLFLGAIPVFYKTHSQFWGQPYVAFFSTLIVWQLFKVLQTPGEFGWKSGLTMGLSGGLLILSRQWGFLVLVAVVVFIVLSTVALRDLVKPSRMIGFLAVMLGISFLIGSWFYFYLYRTEGSFTAFNRNSLGFSLTNKDNTFYRNTGLKDFLLFREPVYGTFNNMFIPMFYSDIWGDYWGFFTLPDMTEHVLAIWDWDGRDYVGARDYLGRVNAVSLILALPLAAGLIWGLARYIQFIKLKEFREGLLYPAFIFLCITASFVGYFWFVLTFPSSNGDTIKASYVIQVFVLLPLLASEVIEELSKRAPRLPSLITFAVGLVVIHNLPAMITRYIYWP